MLQQTRVAAVLEHYRVFLERFPNVHALAAASEDAVVAAWSGLGYYRRARMLHQCARQVVEQHGGRFPNNSKALLALPGIGRYTAAAIASIAFDEPVAVVDGNVERVLQRITGRNLTETWQQAQSLLSPSRPGDFNQAMMELGATVCTPRQPKCPSVPGVEVVCHARRDPAGSPAVRAEKERNLVCARAARRPRPARATFPQRIAHGRHVGASANGPGSSPHLGFSPLANLPAFGHGHRLHRPRHPGRCPRSSYRHTWQMDRDRQPCRRADHRPDA